MGQARHFHKGRSREFRERVQIGDDIGIHDRAHGGFAHRLVQPVFGFEQARAVGEDELRVVPGEEADDGDARGLWLRRYDGEVLADEGVQQCGLADVGSAGEGDGAAAGHGGEGRAKPTCGTRGTA